jgi:hypothetical protein
LSYQPRRSAPVEVEPVPEVVAGVPRRAAATWSDRVLNRGGALAAGVTVVATAAAVAAGVATGVPAAAVAPTTAVTMSTSSLAADAVAAPKGLVSGSASATKATSAALAVAVSRQFTKSSLNVRAKADSDSKMVGHITAGTEVDATAELSGEYRQVVYDDGFAWVLNDELTKVDPNDGIPEGTSMEPCSRGSAVENRLRKTTVFIYRSVCPLFPAVNSYGGWRAGGMQFHKNGRALDIMLTPGKESALGHRIANYLIAHATLFKVDHIIFEQHIWTPSTPHWRKMADRGSLNANHYNHVHVAVVASAP